MKKLLVLAMVLVGITLSYQGLGLSKYYIPTNCSYKSSCFIYRTSNASTLSQDPAIKSNQSKLSIIGERTALPPGLKNFSRIEMGKPIVLNNQQQTLTARDELCYPNGQCYIVMTFK